MECLKEEKELFFLGVSNDVDKEKTDLLFDNFPPKKTNSNKIGDNLKPHKTLRDTIYNLPDPDSDEGSQIPNHIGTKHRVKINGYIGNRKLDWDKISPTIVGRGGGTGGAVIAVHPNCERRFTVRETAMIQSFPDNFIFHGSTGSQFRQIGNAIAVEFAYQLGKTLKDWEENKFKKDNNNTQLNLGFM